MSTKMEINCDAPPYPIVQACNAIGVERPEDVRWMKIDSDELTMVEVLIQATMGTTHRYCGCKEKLPKLAKYKFTYASGDEVCYSVGQCTNCKTVYWKD